MASDEKVLLHELAGAGGCGGVAGDGCGTVSGAVMPFTVDNVGFAAFVRIVGKKTGEARYVGVHGRGWVLSSSLPEKAWRERYFGDGFVMDGVSGSDFAEYNDMCVRMLQAVR